GAPCRAGAREPGGRRHRRRQRPRLDGALRSPRRPAESPSSLCAGGGGGAAPGRRPRDRPPGRPLPLVAPSPLPDEGAPLARALDRGAEVVGYVDADLSTPVAEVARLLDEMEQRGVAVVMGARVALLGTAIQRRALRHYLGRLFATAASIILGLPVYDTQCGA